MASLLENGNKALGVMETQLAKTPYLAGNALSVADIALYAYTHNAAAGGFDMAQFPAVTAWLKRVRETPGFVPIEWLP